MNEYFLKMSWEKGSINTTYNLWNVENSVLRGKFIAMNDCVNKEGLPKWLYLFTFPQIMQEHSFSPHPLSIYCL